MLSDSFVKKDYTPEEKETLKKQEMEQAYLEHAGLEGASVDQLRSTMLSAEEAVCAKQEEMEGIRQRRGRKQNWDEYVDEKRRMGRTLHHSEIIYRLRKLIPSLTCDEGASSEVISLYYYNPRTYFADVQRTGGLINIGWLHKGVNPEYEIDITNDVGIAVGQKRGWRTTLLRLIARWRNPVSNCWRCDRHGQTCESCLPYRRRNSLITEEQALAEFGPPSAGATASMYRLGLWNFRNGN